ncbi:MAG TPA: hypothetical protein VE990_01560 [Acidimicrobiales bacterium]|nr:hypothetical protein [Acidimicrobiales bacterium]
MDELRVEDLNGVFLAGEFKRIEQVMHGPNHATKPNQPVAGMFKIVVGVGPAFAFEQTASFNRQDLATYEESVVSFKVGDGSALVGKQVAVRVSVRGNKQGYANMEALNVYVVGQKV